MTSIFRTTLFSLLTSAIVLAQNPNLPPGFPGGPGQNGASNKEEGTPAPKNLTQALQKPDQSALYPGELSLLNVDGNGMAALYQSVTGKRVLVSTAAKDAQFSFVQAGGLTNGELARLLEKFLLMEGYQLNPDLGNPDIVSFVAVTQPGGGANVVEPVKVIDDPVLLALENGVVSYVMSFQYLKPEEAQRAFVQIYGQLRPGGTIAEVKNASSLIITEKADLIRSLIKLKEKIDVPTAQIATDFVEVKYADVRELADQLTAMFDSQSSNNTSARVQRQSTPRTAPPIPGLATNTVNANPSGGANGGGAASGEDTPPTITPDSRTNRIFLMGRPVDLEFIKKMIRAWDVKSSSRNFLRRKLKYLPVYEFIPIAETAISSTLGESSGNGSSRGGSSRSTSGANNRQLGNTGNNSSRSSNNSSGGNLGGSSRSGGGGGIGAGALSGSNRPTQPESVLVGQTLLVSDNVSNSIIVQGPPHHIEIVENLLGELDVKNEQVAIEAVFARYGLNDNLSFGVNLAQILEGNGIAAQTLSGAGFIMPSDIASLANIAAASAGGSSPFSGGLNVQGITGDFGAFVNAIESYGNFRSFSRPTVFTTNNQEARISSGRQVAITTSNSGTGFSNVNTEFRDVGLELLVRPLVNSSEEITLEISIVRETPATNSSVTGENIPDFLSDQLETTVTVPSGAAVLLGGLIEDDEATNDSGVPILRAIPLIGNFFKNNSNTFGRNELVIMIRPTIVDGEVQLNHYQQVYDQKSNLSQETRKQFDLPKITERKNNAIEKIFGKRTTGKSFSFENKPQMPGAAYRRLESK